MRNLIYVCLHLLLTANLSCGKLVRVDLTHDIAENATAFWQMKDAFKFEKQIRASLPGYEYQANTFCTAEHGGTHTDAPIHFAAGKYTLDKIPLEQLIGKPFIIDVSDESSKNPDYQLDIARLQKAEKQNGRIPDGSILLIYTGFSSKWNNLTEYFGGDPSNSSSYHFPGIAPAAAKWLVDNRKVASVGLDTPSIDYGQSKKFESHVTLYSNNIPGFENVDLSKVKEFQSKKDLLILALPMKIKGGSGGPSRIVATYDDSSDNGSSAIIDLTSLNLVILIAVLSIILV